MFCNTLIRVGSSDRIGILHIHNIAENAAITATSATHYSTMREVKKMKIHLSITTAFYFLHVKLVQHGNVRDVNPNGNSTLHCIKLFTGCNAGLFGECYS